MKRYITQKENISIQYMHFNEKLMFAAIKKFPNIFHLKLFKDPFKVVVK